ncbi:MAG TPA: hypothetical protein VHJ76_06370 [Actinomycetota bacterium]|nr:hypothetical protein [Actinomycetota bacterium]
MNGYLGRTFDTRMLLAAGAVALAVAASSAPAAALQPAGQTRVERVEFGELPSVPAKAGGFLWVLDRRGDTIGKIDPATNQVAGAIDLSGLLGPRQPAWDLDAARGSLWVTIPGRRRLVELDPATGEVVSTVRTRGFVADLYAAHGSLWFSRSTQRRVVLVRLNPKTGKRVAIFRLGRTNTGVTDVVRYGASVWVVREHARHVRGKGRNPTFYVTAALWRIDPGANVVREKAPLGATYTRGAVNPVVGDVAVAREGLWMSRVHERRLVLMDPTTLRVLDVQPVAEFVLPWHVEVLRDDVWVGELNATRVARIDPEAGVTELIETGGTTTYLGRGFGSVWAPVVNEDAGRGEVVRLTPE